MTGLDTIGVDDLRAAVGTYRRALELHRDAINRLNVYPVPDGDTGTNMALTLQSVVDELAGADGSLESACKAISYGSLMGARGNSGVILSQILRGLCSVLEGRDPSDPADWAEALAVASDAAYGAVMKPVEGTILTVVRETAAAAAAAVADGASLVELLDRCRTAAQVALDKTPEQLAVLAEAGVVDAGGAGFVLFLDSLLAVVDGREIPEPSDEAGPVAVGQSAPADPDHGSIADLRYEVMYFLDAPDERIDEFKNSWAEIGDSIVVVGGDGIWNCHIHTDDIGAAIESGIEVGRPNRIRVTDLLEQVDHVESMEGPGGDVTIAFGSRAPAVTAVVAVAAGDGVRRIFESLGVQAVVTGGQTMNPSTQVLLQAVEQVDAEQVVILPNNKNIIPVAEQVDGVSAKSVAVVPTRGIAEGFASLLAYDPQADIETNVDGMAEAASAVVAGEVTVAVRDSVADGATISAGQFLGMRRDGVEVVAGSLVEAATGLLAALIGPDHELVTIIQGADATDEDTSAIVEWLAAEQPELEVEVHHGGQPLYPYYLGVE